MLTTDLCPNVRFASLAAMREMAAEEEYNSMFYDNPPVMECMTAADAAALVRRSKRRRKTA